MSDEVKQYSLLCPFCKEVITFGLKEEDLQSRYSGGLAGVIIPSHGNPPHTIEVYIDREGLIRAAYPQLTVDEAKTSLQNHYITDSTSEITPDEGKALGVVILPFTVTIDDSPQRNYNEEIFFPEIYEHFKADRKVRSQPVSVNAFLTAFREAPRDKQIVVLLVSKRYSEGYNNAMVAKMVLQKEDPEKAEKIHLIDSKTTGPMMRLMMNEVLDLDENGASFDDILDHLKWMSEKHISYIYVDSLDALRRSERVGRIGILRS